MSNLRDEKLGTLKVDGRISSVKIRARDLDLEEIAAAIAPFIQLECDCICGSSDS